MPTRGTGCVQMPGSCGRRCCPFTQALRCLIHSRIVIPILRRVVAGTLVGMVLCYLGDELILRYRIHGGSNPYGQVTVHRLDAIPEKGGKIEYAPEEPVVETCVHSLFPHNGYLPCWYLSRKTEQRVNY